MTRTRATPPAAAVQIESGTLAARPAAGVADRYYWATDIYTMFRDTGAAWEVVGAQWSKREIHSEGLFGRSSFSALATGWVIYCPIQIPRTITADGIIVYHGVTGAGNFYIALYNHTGYLPNVRLAVSVSTAAAGAGQCQFVPFTSPLQITPDVYFTAIESDNNADDYMNAADSNIVAIPANVAHGLKWFYENLGAYMIPPATATPTYCAATLCMIQNTLRISAIP